MDYILPVLVVGAAVLLWNKLGDLLLGHKIKKLEKNYEEQRTQVQEKVITASVNAKSFLERYREYKSRTGK